MEIKKAKENLVIWLEAQVGYIGKKSNSQLDNKTANIRGKFTKYARDLDNLGYYNGRKNGYDYCNVFVNDAFVACFGFPTGQKMAYQPPKSMGAACKYSYNYYKQNGAAVTEPEVGDQIFFRYTTEIGHTGIVYKVSQTAVWTIEGNVNCEVVRRYYKKNNRCIAGYGRPNWALVANVEPSPTPTPTPTHSTLSKGSTNHVEVRELQNDLITIGMAGNPPKNPLPKYGADGDFGNETYNAVVAFQKANKLEADGIVGPKTWAEIDKQLAAINSKPAPTPTPAPSPKEEYISYTVKAGDTLGRIAEKYNTTVEILAKLNNISNPSFIRVGQILKIPK